MFYANAPTASVWFYLLRLDLSVIYIYVADLKQSTVYEQYKADSKLIPFPKLRKKYWLLLYAHAISKPADFRLAFSASELWFGILLRKYFEYSFA